MKAYVLIKDKEGNVGQIVTTAKQAKELAERLAHVLEEVLGEASVEAEPVVGNINLMERKPLWPLRRPPNTKLKRKRKW